MPPHLVFVRQPAESISPNRLQAFDLASSWAAAGEGLGRNREACSAGLQRRAAPRHSVANRPLLEIGHFRTYGHINRETAVGKLASGMNSLISLSKGCHVRVSFSNQRRREPEPVNRNGPPAPARETGARHWEGGTLWHVLGSSQLASRPLAEKLARAWGVDPRETAS
jgi:hypothetical protein